MPALQRVVLIILAGAILASCAKKSNPVSEEPTPPVTPTTQALTPRSGSFSVSQSQMQQIDSLSSSSIEFSGSVPANIRPGTIIYSDGYSSEASKGFLRKVVSISGNTVNTSPASLSDAFSNGELDFTIYPSSLQKTSAEGVKVKSTSATNVIYNLNYLIYDADADTSTTDDQLRLEGSIIFDGSLVGKLTLPLKVSTTFGISGTLDLNLVATGGLSYTAQKTLFVADGTPLVVSGVVLTPEVTVTFVPSISLKGEATAGIDDNINLNSSVSYDAGWKNTSSFTNTFTANPVKVEINGQLKGELLFGFTIYLYEVVGPGVEIGPYAELDVNTSQNPWWSLYAGAEGNLTINSRGIASAIGDYAFPLFQNQKLIGQSQDSPPQQNEPPNTPSSPGPSDGASGIASPVTVSWNDSDPDGDPLTYSLIYAAGTNLPTRINNITQASYNLGDIPGGEQILWKVIAYDNHADSAAGPLWSFTTANAPTQYPPENTGPADGSNGIILPVTLSWESSDPNVPLKYDLYIGTDSLNMNIFQNIVWNYYPFDGPASNGTKIFWKVNVKDSKGNVFTGPLWAFTVGNPDTGPEYSSFTDLRDGHVYKTVKIGNQWWFAENLNYYTNSSVYYNNDSADYNEYGRLYSWQDAQNACPTGWHIPSQAEFDSLINSTGGPDLSGGNLKETGTAHWNSPNTGATNEYGFSALGAGVFYQGGFYNLKTIAEFWSSTSIDSYSSYIFPLNYNTAQAICIWYENSNFVSVRPVKDN